MSDQPIDIHYVQLEDWLRGREDLITRKHSKQYKQLLEIAPRMVQMAKYDVPSLKKTKQRQAALAEELRRRVDSGMSEVDQLRKQQQGLLEAYELVGIAKAALPSDTPTEEVISVARNHLGSILDVRLNCAFRSLCTLVKESALDLLPRSIAAFQAHIDHITKGGASSDINIPMSSDLFPVLTKLIELANTPIEVDGPVEWKYVKVEANKESGKEEGQISWDTKTEPTIDFGGDNNNNDVQQEGGAIEINWGGGEEGEIIISDTNKGNTPSSTGGGVEGYAQVLVDSGVVLTNIAQLLHRAELRGALMDEIDAILAFLNETVQPSSQGDQASRDALVSQTVVAAHRSLANDLTTSLMSVLRDPSQQELLRLRSDLQSRVVFREGIMRLSSYADSIVSKRDELVAQSDAAAAAALALAPKLEEAIQGAQVLQQRCEAILCSVFTPRPVYLSGDINAL